MILALDLSTKSTGYSIFDGKKLISHGCITATDDSAVKRIYYIAEQIKVLLEHYPINIVAMEEVIPKADAYDDKSPHHANSAVFKPLMWMQAAVVFLAHDIPRNINVEYVLPNVWRAALGIKTGRGVKRETLKQADCRWVLEHYNVQANDDECDAIALGAHYVQKNDSFDWS